MGSIALQGVRQCDLGLGENVCVMGLGLPGLLAVQMFKASGVRVIGFDPDAARCDLARDLGADQAMSTDLAAGCEAFSRGFGMDAVLITAAAKSNEPVTLAGEISRMKGILEVGFIGAGNFTRSVLLPVLKKQAHVQLKGICTATGMNAAQTGRREGFDYAVTDYQQLLDDPQIQAVFVTTRHNSHARFVTAALIKEYFQGRKTPMMVNYRINAGIIAPDVWIQDPEVGGGRIIGEVCHFIDFASFVIGADPVEVQAFLDAVKTGGPPPIPFASLALTTACTFAARQSFRTGGGVRPALL